jgi:hypothetical protein
MSASAHIEGKVDGKAEEDKREEKAPYGLPTKRGIDRFGSKEWESIVSFISSKIWDQDEPSCEGL